jgi:hypothetical protein
MARKTIEVEKVKAALNNYLSASPDDAVGQRIGIASALEHILHVTGNYHGFRYLHYVDSSRPNHRSDDETRRYYF